MKTEMKMETRLLSELHQAEYNPRVALKPGDEEYEKIRRSIETFGYVDPIIVNQDGTIIGGHQRYSVLTDLGYSEVQVVVVDLSKDDEKALNVALNKISGEWDEVKLQEILHDLDLNGYNFELTGFNRVELENLDVKLEIDEEAQEDDDFDIEKEYENIKQPVTKRGDVWILGRHRLMCGDSTSKEDMEKLMSGHMVDLVITDPPYNVAYGDKVDHMNEYLEQDGPLEDATILNDDMDDEAFHDFLYGFYQRAFESMKEGAAIYVFHADSNGYVFRETYREAGFKLAECLIWEKNTFVLGRQDYQWQHEPILYGWKPGAGHYFINDRTQSTILCEDKPKRNGVHPTMKPVPLVGRLMKNSSKPGWMVLDCFGGSGTTIMAAEQLNRTAFSMELDEKFCDVIVKRWEEYTGEKAVLEGNLGDISL